MQQHTGKLAASVGDGGNDVAMILQANVGIGLVGKEGNQASLSADFSVNQFSYLQRLILLHGRHAYLRSALAANQMIQQGLVVGTI